MTDRAPFIVGAAVERFAPVSEDLAHGLYLGGYGTYGSRRAEGVLDSPCARAVYMAGRNRAFVLVGLDLVGLDTGSVRTLRRRVSAAIGLPVDAVLVSCSHSHSSPDTQGIWGGAPASYLRRLLDAAVGAARSAHLRAGPASLRVASTEVRGLTKNRRGWPDVDSTLVALQAVDADGGALATVVNFACHPTTLPPENLLVSRDFPGVLVDRLDAELGGITLFVNGALGDVNPVESGDFERTRAFGEALARAAADALRNADPVSAGLELLVRRPALPVAPARLPRWAQRILGPATPPLRTLASLGVLARGADTLARSGRPDVAQIVGGFAATLPGMLAGRRGPVLETWVGVLTFGAEVAAVTAPGEALTRLALPVKGSLPARHRLLLGLTCDSLGYLLDPDEWMAAPSSGYEESVSLGKDAGPAWRRTACELSAALGSP